MTSENIITDTEPERIEFRQFHQPTLKTGDYSITVEQKAQTVGDGRIPATTFRKQNLFSVASEQFVFNPPLINAVFPPDGNLGDHFNIFPHIILNRSTLPWERTATEKDENVPWLALLLFDAAEAVAPKIMTLAELSKPSQDARVKWRGVKPEAGQNPTDKVTVIEVQKSVLENIMPTAADLAWLAHARQGKNIAGTKSGDELAIIIGNRLPRKGASSTVHLVSVENRYTTGGEFDFQKAAPEDLIRLVSLKSWSFTCADSRQNFKGLLKKLDPFDVAGFDQKRSLLRLPPPENALPEAEKYLSA